MSTDSKHAACSLPFCPWLHCQTHFGSRSVKDRLKQTVADIKEPLTDGQWWSND